LIRRRPPSIAWCSPRTRFYRFATTPLRGAFGGLALGSAQCAGKFLATATGCDSWLRRRVAGPDTDDEQSFVLDTKLFAATARTRAWSIARVALDNVAARASTCGAEPRSRFTPLMERLVIGLIHQCGAQRRLRDCARQCASTLAVLTGHIREKESRFLLRSRQPPARSAGKANTVASPLET
jgi:hypothetical protein